ncbi:MAG TPA: UDP-2,3-diacylglucosamine diphosphatase [Isosphaeraceae bacterium]|nr:UDP-2,3-diacylglucosamine diphosphatase [Isosphaeraceae bacterium]
MPDYFLSDVHLRLDRPDRGRRLARLVDTLTSEDRVFGVGDLCDFWFASREDRGQAERCPGLSALRAFQGRGGKVRILLGNHDGWLGPFYESFFGVAIDPEPLRVESHGLRLRLEHGHHRKGKRVWKRWMEGRTFLRAFRMLPERLARGLEQRLDSVNEARKAESDRRMTEAYREFVGELADTPDFAVFGHVHKMLYEPVGRTRLVVLGDWLRAASYLRIDGEGARLVKESEESSVSKPVRGLT